MRYNDDSSIPSPHTDSSGALPDSRCDALQPAPLLPGNMPSSLRPHAFGTAPNSDTPLALAVEP